MIRTATTDHTTRTAREQTSAVSPASRRSKALLWTGRVLSTVITLLLCLDGVMKLLLPAPVIQASAQLGYQGNTIFGIGIVLLVCTLLYAVPRTAILGAVLLTGYLGGATATHVRVDSGWFSVLFPGILGMMVWGGLYLRDSRLRALLPLQQA